MNEILLGIAQRAVAWLAANHPKRVRARQRVFTFAVATLANLRGGVR